MTALARPKYATLLAPGGEASMPYEMLEVTNKEELTLITINRPKALNALNRKVLEELDDAFTRFEQDGASKVCVITGGGEKAFVAGADISGMADMTPLEAQAFCRFGQEVFLKIEAIEKPVLAAVNGFALGGGTELVLACDLVYASEKAQFGQPEINLGIIPGFGGTQRLAKVIGMRRAKEWIYLGDMVDAKTAKAFGLVNEVFAPEKLMDEVEAVAKKLAAKSPFALGQAKKTIERGLVLDLYAGSVLEREAFSMTFASEDSKEGMQAFLEKRKPAFKGK
jgi:enoyl-CoA hydratase